MLYELPFSNPFEMLTIHALAITLSTLQKKLCRNPTVLPGNLLKHGNGYVLRPLDASDKFPSLIERFHGPRVQPGIASTQGDDRQASVLKIHAVKVGNLELATGRRPDFLCKLADTTVIELEASYRITALGMLGLLLN